MSVNSNFLYPQKISHATTQLVKLTEVSSSYKEFHLLKPLIHMEATFAIIIYIYESK
jgi:hypothetical protein